MPRRNPTAEERQRARAAANMIPGFAIVDAPGQIASRIQSARNRRPTPQSQAAEQRRVQELRAARLAAERRRRPGAFDE